MRPVRPFLVTTIHPKMLLYIILLFVFYLPNNLTIACLVNQDCFPELGPNSTCIGSRCICDHQAGFYISQSTFTCENYFLKPASSSVINIALPESPVLWFLFFFTIFTIISIICVCAIRRQKAVKKRTIAQRFF